MKRPYHSEATARTQSPLDTANRIKLMERARKAEKVTTIANHLRARGSFGLVIPYANPNTKPIKDGLLAHYNTEDGDKNVRIMNAEGAVQGRPKDSKSTHMTLSALQLFRERTGKNGLFILESFDFRSGDDEGTPEINDFFSGIINKATEPQILVIGHGKVSDLRHDRNHDPAVQSNLTKKLGEIAAWVEGSVSFDPPQPQQQRSPLAAPAHVSFTPIPPVEAQLGYTQLPKTL